MQLIETLAIGCRGAENGYARLFTRGTSQRATWYTDFEGTVPVQTGQDIPLDGYGAAVVYVNSTVDVMLLDADGVTVRSFTASEGSPRVEVISQSFTGRDYISGAEGTGLPLTLQEVLDEWLESAGSPDWMVLLNGEHTTIQDALAQIGGFFYNIRAYGAAGDGTTDDRAAIQAAYDAAAVTGGIVFWPASIAGYRITGHINITTSQGTVNTLGAGAQCATVLLDSATGDAFRFLGSSIRWPITIRGLAFFLAQTTTGTFIRLENDVDLNVAVYDCSFRAGATFNTAYHVGSSANASFVRALFFNCYFDVGLGKAANAQDGSLQFSHCHFTTSKAAHNTKIIDGTGGNNPAILVESCEFDLSVVTTTPHYIIQFGSDYPTTSQFPHGVFRSGFRHGAASQAFVITSCGKQDGNRATSNIEFYDDAAATLVSAFNNTYSLDIERGIRTAALGGSGSYTLPLHAGTIVLTYSFAGNLDIVFSSWIYGRKWRIFIHNTSGVNRSITWTLPGGAGSMGTAGSSVVNATLTLLEVECLYANAKRAFYFREQTNLLVP